MEGRSSLTNPTEKGNLVHSTPRDNTVKKTKVFYSGLKVPGVISGNEGLRSWVIWVAEGPDYVESCLRAGHEDNSGPIF